MVRQSLDNIISNVLTDFNEKKVLITAPIIKGRKGHYKELFAQIRKRGFTTVRVDGEVIEITKNLQLDRYVIHDIDIIIDKLIISRNNYKRLKGSIDIALKSGDKTMYIIDENNKSTFYSKLLVDPESVFHTKNPLLIVFPLILLTVGVIHVRVWRDGSYFKRKYN